MPTRDGQAVGNAMRPSQALAKHRAKVMEVIARYPVSNPRLVGSAARGDDTEASDLDILVERGEGLTYFTIAGLEIELKGLLGVPVDVRTEGEFSSRSLALLLRDLRPL